MIGTSLSNNLAIAAANGQKEFSNLKKLKAANKSLSLGWRPFPKSSLLENLGKKFRKIMRHLGIIKFNCQVFLRVLTKKV